MADVGFLKGPVAELEAALSQPQKLDSEYQRVNQETSTEAFFASRGGFVSALKPENRRKNRYSNILPFENSRVELPSLDEDATDYVNANWVKGSDFGCPYSYICCQGPLDTTICDFWRMVLETKSRVVVMLTREMEAAQEKCSVYWETSKYPHVEVRLEATDHPGPSIVRRKLCISRPGGADALHVTQLQFIAWPDFGVPASATPILQLMRLTEEVAGEPDAPLVVHCSAGVGRSGSFVTCHVLLSRLEAAIKSHTPIPDPVSVPRIVRRLRDFRVLLVQKKDQYRFCFEAVLEGAKYIATSGRYI